MKKWEKFSDQELQQIIKNSRSIREVAIKLGYSPDGGGSITIIKDMLETKKFDISHFAGQGWNKNNFNYSRFQYGKVIKITSALPAITALRGYKCEQCHLTQWNGQQIPLEIHHIDGNHLNNNLDNLQLLCPNCHALTDNYCGKNIVKGHNKKEISDEEFIQALQTTPNVRQALLKLGLTGAGGNYARAYNLLHQYNIKQYSDEEWEKL